MIAKKHNKRSVYGVRGCSHNAHCDCHYRTGRKYWYVNA